MKRTTAALVSAMLLFCSTVLAAEPEKGDTWMGLRWGMSVEEAQRILGADIIPAPPRVKKYTHTLRGWRIANQSFTVGLRFEGDKLNFIQLSCDHPDENSMPTFTEIANSLSEKYGKPKIVDKSDGKHKQVDLEYLWKTEVTTIEATFYASPDPLSGSVLYVIYNPATKPGEGL